MDEQRLAAYLQRIQALLECPNGTNDILYAHRELVDADFVQIVEALAENMAAEGNSNACWWQNLASHLKNSVRSTATPEEYFFFLMEVLQATIISGGSPQVVYPILQQNFDKLNLIFARILQTWATSIFTKVTSEHAASIAAAIGTGALPLQRVFLGDKFLIRYIPSCRILEYCSQRPTIESLKYGIVENATDDLYFTPFECEQVAAIVPVTERS